MIREIQNVVASSLGTYGVRVKRRSLEILFGIFSDCSKFVKGHNGGSNGGRNQKRPK